MPVIGTRLQVLLCLCERVRRRARLDADGHNLVALVAHDDRAGDLGQTVQGRLAFDQPVQRHPEVNAAAAATAAAAAAANCRIIKFISGG